MPQKPKATRYQQGPLYRVPCAWCGRPMDLRQFAGSELNLLKDKDYKVEGDCGHMNKIVKYDTTPRVVVERTK